MQRHEDEAGRLDSDLQHGSGVAPAARNRARICMLSFYFSPAYSGSAEQAHNLSRRLLRRGLLLEVVSANLTGSPPVEELGGVRVRRLPIVKKKTLQIPSFSLSLAWYLFRHRSEYQIVHAHGTFQHAVASVICRALGKKSILKIAMGNSDLAFQRQGRTWGRINRFLVRRFDRYIATSAEVYRECVAHGLEESRVRLIPNGVDTAKFRPAAFDEERRRARRDLQLPDKPIVCFVGIMDARKNVDGILRVWRSVVRSGAVGHLVLVGPEPLDDGGERSEFCEQLRRFVAEEGLTETVTFTGRQEDVASYLRSADIFFFPSRREGMPNVLLEAMASGLACVASNIGGSVDLIDDDHTGCLVPLDDEDSMAGRIQTLLVDVGRSRELGRAARQAVVEGFSLEVTAERYMRLYQELLTERSRLVRRHKKSAGDTP